LDESISKKSIDATDAAVKVLEKESTLLFEKKTRLDSVVARAALRADVIYKEACQEH